MIADICEERYLEVESYKMPYWVYGDMRRPVIFYLHGFANAFSENSGDLPVRYLMQKYCVIAFDLPGWGKSKSIKKTPQEIVSRISQTNSIKKFFLFGTSYGGALSLLYAISCPEKLNGVIIAGVPRFGLRSIFSFFAFTKFLSFKKSRALIDLFSVAKNASKIKIPVLLLYSKNDQVATVSNGNYFSKKIKNSNLVAISGRNHNWLLHRIIDNDFGNEIDLFLKNYS